MSTEQCLEMIDELDVAPATQKRLKSLLQPVSIEDIPYFIQEIRNYQEELTTRDDFHEVADAQLLDNLVNTSLFLLKKLDDYSSSQRQLILAALRNFILDEEGEADAQHPYTFDSDARIINEVLYLLGDTEQVIPV